MTLDEIRQSSKATLTPGDVAAVLHSDPQTIRVAAHTRPELLGFPVFCIGNRVKIPRLPFLTAIGGD